MVCVYVTKSASLCVGPRLEMYKMAGFDAGNALAGLTSAGAPRVLAVLPNSEIRCVSYYVNGPLFFSLCIGANFLYFGHLKGLSSEDTWIDHLAFLLLLRSFYDVDSCCKFH